ncbi:MAG TPA: HlyD family efflux transporter periplasmic adaptor subunit, partial [Gemmataceae bacterium]|nr:HlyD family efflux transporter periplasmic adaptor subunit [Gemmataceae bacterium]
AVHVRENQDVRAGDLLAELQNDTQKHQVALAEADLALAKAQLDFVRNGERKEKRQAAAAEADGKHVRWKEAQASYRRALQSGRGASPEAVDSAYYQMLKAEAEWKEAKARADLLEAPARADEIAQAEARVRAAEARLKLAKDELAKTRLVAPCDGRVLQVFAEPGELAGPATAQPVLVLADLSKRRVRAFVEELDATRVREGQQVVITADALPGHELTGRVSVVVPRMGRRAPQSDAPGEYKDVHFREVLIDLDAAEDLPVNLRVQVRIRSEPPSEAP